VLIPGTLSDWWMRSGSDGATAGLALCSGGGNLAHSLLVTGTGITQLFVDFEVAQE
jgi:hypothetical protein